MKSKVEKSLRTIALHNLKNNKKIKTKIYSNKTQIKTHHRLQCIVTTETFDKIKSEANKRKMRLGVYIDWVFRNRKPIRIDEGNHPIHTKDAFPTMNDDCIEPENANFHYPAFNPVIIPITYKPWWKRLFGKEER